MKFQAIKGVRDILPPESALWNRVEQAAREVFRTYGYGEIRLPIFEPTELFARSVGLDTDIVSKEMYSFEDRPADLPDPRDLDEIGMYIAEVREMLNRGEIPNSKGNLDAFERFDQAFKDFAAESRRMPLGFSQGPPGAPPFLEKYLLLFRSAVYFAVKVQLGESISLRPEATASVVR